MQGTPAMRYESFGLYYPLPHSEKEQGLMSVWTLDCQFLFYFILNSAMARRAKKKKKKEIGIKTGLRWK